VYDLGTAKGNVVNVLGRYPKKEFEVKHASTLLALSAATVLLLGSSQRAHAHQQSDTEPNGAYSLYVEADVTAPAPNAVFHTGNQMAMSMNISYSAVCKASATSDGTQGADSVWNVYHELYLDVTTNILDQGQALNLNIAAGTAVTVQYTKNLSKLNHSTGTGGHTAGAKALVSGTGGSHNISDQHSFSVVAP
jgi:hypothetical protein